MICLNLVENCDHQQPAALKNLFSSLCAFIIPQKIKAKKEIQN